MNVYQVLLRPILTEKTDLQRDANQYVFEVNRKANKLQIKQAVEQIFDVELLKVNIVNVPPKCSRRARSRRLLVRRSGYKKAIITLAPDDRIPFFEGVE